LVKNSKTYLLYDIPQENPKPIFKKILIETGKLAASVEGLNNTSLAIAAGELWPKKYSGRHGP